MELSLATWAALQDPFAAVPSPTPELLTFDVHSSLPRRRDRWILAFFNCARQTVYLEGTAHFVGGRSYDEELSISQETLLIVRYILLSVAAFAAIVLAVGCVVQRSVAIPLHWALITVLGLDSVHQILLIIPLSLIKEDRYQLGKSIFQSHAWTTEPDALSLSAVGVSLLASIIFVCVLLAISAGRHFATGAIPSRECHVFYAAMVMYFIFGMLQESCLGEVSCGVFILSFQVVRILIIFGILLFLNASAEQLRRAHGSGWSTLGAELVRLHSLRALRLRLLLISLVLPIFFMFLEVQVLDWNSDWFKVFWREALELYLVLIVAWRFAPSVENYATHFGRMRPAPHTGVRESFYTRFFRWLLGGHIDAQRATAAVQEMRRRREALRQ